MICHCHNQIPEWTRITLVIETKLVERSKKWGKQFIFNESFSIYLIVRVEIDQFESIVDSQILNSNDFAIFRIIFHLAADAVSVPRFTRRSWLAFPALRGAYKHIQVIIHIHISIGNSGDLYSRLKIARNNFEIINIQIVFAVAHWVSARSLRWHCIAHRWTWRFDGWFFGGRSESRIYRILVSFI